MKNPMIIFIGLCCLFFGIFSDGLAQSSNITNIPVPGANLGLMPEDMVIADNKLFIYSTAGIAVYSAQSPYSYITTYYFDLPSPVGQSNMNVQTVIENRTRYSTMAFNGTNAIYVVAPDYHIWKLSLNDNTFVPVAAITPPFSGGFIGGSVILMFDSNTQWLFYAVQSPYQTNSDALGQFIGIYDTEPVIAMIYNESRPGSDIHASIYDIYIDYVNPASSYFYLSRKFIIEVYSFSHQGTNSVDLFDTILTENQAKHGRLIKLQDAQDMNKLICLPLQNRNENRADLYVIDAEDPEQHHLIPQEDLPARKILDAEYDEMTGKLLFAVKPNEPQEDDYDLYIYSTSINGQNQLELTFSQKFITDQFYTDDTCNYPNNIQKTEQSTYLISKNSEISQITYVLGQNYVISSTPIDARQNNYYERAIDAGSTFHVLRPMGGGLTIKPYLAPPHNIETSCFLNKGFFNENNNRVYFFGEKLVYPYTVFMMNAVDYSLTKKDMGIPFVDMILNPASNEIIVSRFDDQPGCIRVYNPDMTNYNEYLAGENTSYCGNMFLDANGLLYVTTGMKTGEVQGVSIFNTRNSYHLDGNFALQSPSFFPTPTTETDPPNELTASFLWNPYDLAFPVYLYITHNTSPYLPPSTTNKKTSLYRMNAGGSFEYINFDQMCYDFVLADNNEIFMAFDNDLKAIECDNNLSASTVASFQIIDLEFDGAAGKVYGLTREGSGIQRIKSIDMINPTSTDLIVLPATISNMKYLASNRTMYAYSDIDQLEIPPNDNVKVHLINVLDPQSYVSEPVGLNSLVRNHYSNNLEYDLIYDNINHKLFIPQGGQSKIGVLQNMMELLTFKPGWNWVSFPRLERDGNGTYVTEDLLENILPSLASGLELKYRMPQKGIDAVFINRVFVNPNWIGSLTEVKSSLGYKLNTAINDISFLPMTGSVLAPGTVYDDDLVAFVPNWTGYFLETVQSPFDAIGTEFLDKITWMAGQYWYCHKESTPGAQSSGYWWRCACEQGRIELKYADMIEIFPSEDISGFHWQTAGQPPLHDPKGPSALFSYQEQTEYDAIMIELDTSNLPLEIGAFAADTCIGATTVHPDDTLALICAYTQGFEGEEITFEMVYPTKTIMQNNDYIVLNTGTGIREKRRIIAGEDQPYFLVSFNMNTSQWPSPEPDWVQCRPNPANQEVIISYRLAREGQANLELSDAMGRTVMRWNRNRQNAGTYTFSFSTQALPNGVYQLILDTGYGRTFDKLIIFH